MSSLSGKSGSGRFNRVQTFHRSKRGYGFTLVELLVVVLVIFVLIAIGMPQFLEAVTRSNVARSASEIRVLITALETYKQDWRVYPRDHNPDYPFAAATEFGFFMLTTPIRYLGKWLYDPFGTRESIDPSTQNISSAYTGGSGSDNPDCGGIFHYADRSSLNHNADCSHGFIVSGIGPDKTQSVRGWRSFPSGDPSFTYPCVIDTYSPSNGTRSRGDIYQMTGDWRQKTVSIDGRPLGG